MGMQGLNQGAFAFFVYLHQFVYFGESYLFSNLLRRSWLWEVKRFPSKCPKWRLLSGQDLLGVKFNLTVLWGFLYICIEQRRGGRQLLLARHAVHVGKVHDNSRWPRTAKPPNPPPQPDSLRNASALPPSYCPMTLNNTFSAQKRGTWHCPYFMALTTNQHNFKKSRGTIPRSGLITQKGLTTDWSSKTLERPSFAPFFLRCH